MTCNTKTLMLLGCFSDRSATRYYEDYYYYLLTYSLTHLLTYVLA